VKVRDVASFLAFAAMIVLGLGYLGSLGVSVKPPDQRTNLAMEVPDVNGLVVGANVLLRGVPVGKISNIATTVGGASIGFYIDDRYRVPVDSEVRLENLSALGETYIGLVPRSEGGPVFHDGQHIATDAIIQPASVSELATSVVRVLNQLDPGALDRIVDEGDVSLPDPVTVLPNLSHASTLLRNTAMSMNGRGRQLLDNFQTLLRNSEWVGPVLADLAPYIYRAGRDFQEVFSAYSDIIARGAPQTLINLRHLLERIQKFLDSRGGDLKVLFEAFRPGMTGIAGALMNLDTGQLLENLLATVPPDGTITLHVATPGN
jgi:phospholipid/cholesterol/gamma-HCH transport system substrate-binding protein